jgi:hypothetical protein
MVKLAKCSTCLGQILEPQEITFTLTYMLWSPTSNNTCFLYISIVDQLVHQAEANSTDSDLKRKQHILGSYMKQVEGEVFFDIKNFNSNLFCV